MKIRLVVALVASSFASPILAQQTDQIDEQMAHQRNLLADAKAPGEFGVLGIKEEEAFSKNDAAVGLEATSPDPLEPRSSGSPSEAAPQTSERYPAA
ncbi:MAG: hypothetical protein JO232_23310 [Verrucomicrobia bacterium]|nr:hypothetical protein [Verrucomicrobiota bacterium]